MGRMFKCKTMEVRVNYLNEEPGIAGALSPWAALGLSRPRGTGF